MDVSSYRGKWNIIYEEKLKTFSKLQKNIEDEHSGSKQGIVSHCLISEPEVSFLEAG
jgi:hypothetical protein